MSIDDMTVERRRRKAVVRTTRVYAGESREGRQESAGGIVPTSGGKCMDLMEKRPWKELKQKVQIDRILRVGLTDMIALVVWQIRNVVRGWKST